MNQQKPKGINFSISCLNTSRDIHHDIPNDHLFSYRHYEATSNDCLHCISDSDDGMTFMSS